MDVEELSVLVRSVDWGSLKGAYGPSDGSQRRSVSMFDPATRQSRIVDLVLGDVPTALETLARVRDARSPEWQEAYEVLESHVVHQGDIDSVTPVVVSILCDLLAIPGVAGRPKLAYFLLSAALASRTDRPGEPAKFVPHGRDVHEALAAKGDRIEGWLDTEIDQEAMVLMASVDELRARLLRAICRREELPGSVFVVLAMHVESPPEWLVDLARDAQSSEERMMRDAAAVVLSRQLH